MGISRDEYISRAVMTHADLIVHSKEYMTFMHPEELLRPYDAR